MSFRWKPSEETVILDGSVKNDEAIVRAPEGSDLISFTFPPTLIVGAVYKVNVYSVVDAANQVDDELGCLMVQSKLCSVKWNWLFYWQSEASYSLSVI